MTIPRGHSDVGGQSRRGVLRHRSPPLPLRLFTSGGFSPNGVGGFEPQDFAKYFQLTAAGPCGTTVTVSRPDTRYRVRGGYIEVKGIADRAPD